jgi:outer membrane protein
VSGTMRISNRVAIAVVSVLLAAGAVALQAEDLPRAEWEVGQEAASPRDLGVTVPPPAPAELTIQEAVESALRYNVGFRRTIQSLLSARSAWWVAGQRWDLELFGAVSRAGNGETAESREVGASLSYYALTGANISVTTELSKLDSEEDEHRLVATLRQPLLAGAGPASSAYEEVRRARNAYRSALVSFFASRQSLIERVISAYFNAVRQKQVVGIQMYSVELAEGAVTDAKVRLEEGLLAEIDLTRAQLRLSREKAAAVSQQQSMRDSMDNLLLLLGLQVGGMPDLVSTVSYAPEGVDSEAAIRQALDLRPELRVAELGIENREAALRINRSEARPALDLFGGWSDVRNGTSEKSWNLGLELSVPISSRRLRDAVREAEWNLLVERQDFEDLKQEVVAEVRSQVRAAEAAQADVDIQLESVNVAKRSLHLAERMVEEGLRTNRDLLEAQDDLTRSESSLVTSKINHYLAVVRLRRAIGMDIGQDLPTERAAPEGEKTEEMAAP